MTGNGNGKLSESASACTVRADGGNRRHGARGVSAGESRPRGEYQLHGPTRGERSGSRRQEECQQGETRTQGATGEERGPFYRRTSIRTSERPRGYGRRWIGVGTARLRTEMAMTATRRGERAEGLASNPGKGVGGEWSAGLSSRRAGERSGVCCVVGEAAATTTAFERRRKWCT